nr:MAG TPA: hypothetical protein [Caudoviricetes sp.]
MHEPVEVENWIGRAQGKPHTAPVTGGGFGC